jgi:hypothetical protein
LDDFTYLVKAGKQGPFHFREVRPKDFYLAQTIREKKGSFIPLIMRLSLNTEQLLESPSPVFRAIIKWTIDTLLEENILTAENWMELSFHLNKQRWDSGVDWLENQPMSKIKVMISINEKVADDQEKQMKRNR